MAESTLISIAFFLICVLFIMLLIAFTRIIKMQKMLTDVSPKDLYPFLEELRELVIESERIADKLEDEITKKEEILEDIASLAEEKLRRLETINDNPSENPAAALLAAISNTPPAAASAPKPAPNPAGQLSIRDRISDLIAVGMSDTQIASELGVSTTEVQIVRRLEN